MNHYSRRQFMGTTAAAAMLASLPAQVMAEEAMLETLTIVTGFPPGGTSDILCRRVAEALRGKYARAAVVENRTGAGGQIAVNAIKSMPPDGSAMLQTPSTMLSIYPHTYRNLSYRPFEDLTPVSLACTFVFGYAVGASVPESVRSVADYVEWVRANPRFGNFGSPGAGASPHFIGAMLARDTGIDLQHVAFRGTQPAIADAIGGHLGAVCGPLGEFLPHLSDKRIRLIAVTGETRSRFAPDVPTFLEQGLKNLTIGEWYGFFLPAGASSATVNRLNTALRKALTEPALVEGLAISGMEAASSTPEELAAYLRRDTEFWGPVVQSIGFSADT